MSEHLVKRLREAGDVGLDLSPGDSLCAEAADHIAAQEQEIEQLRQRLNEARLGNRAWTRQCRKRPMMTEKLAALLRAYMADRESRSLPPEDMADWLAAHGVVVLPKEPSEAAKEAGRVADDRWWDFDGVDPKVDWMEYVLCAAYAAERREGWRER